MVSALDVLKEGFAKLHKSEEFSDCKLICGTYHFNLHKVVLSSQSEYFKVAFKSGAFKEGESGTIELKAVQNDSDNRDEQDDVCDDPEIVKLMVEYFYHFDYANDCDVGDTAASSATAAVAPRSGSSLASVSMVEHAKVFAMAVKYQVDGLRDLAVTKFSEAVEENWDRDDFAYTVFLTYNTTADDVTGIRRVVADTLYEHFDALKDNDAVESVVRNIPGLGYDFSKRSRSDKVLWFCGHAASQSEKACSSCFHKFKYCTTCYRNKKCTHCARDIHVFNMCALTAVRQGTLVSLRCPYCAGSF